MFRSRRSTAAAVCLVRGIPGGSLEAIPRFRVLRLFLVAVVAVVAVIAPAAGLVGPLDARNAWAARVICWTVPLAKNLLSGARPAFSKPAE